MTTWDDVKVLGLPHAAVVIQARPAPQGSKRHVGGGRMVEQSKLLPGFRQELDLAMTQARPAEPMHGPVHVGVAFVWPRPASHYRTGRFSALLREDAPRWRWAWPCSRGDADKLLRAVHDGLERNGWLGNDAQVSAWAGSVTWCERDQPYRVVVEVQQLEPTEEVQRVRRRSETAPGAAKAPTARRPRRRRRT